MFYHSSMITIAKPTISREEEKAILNVLRSGKLTQGIWVKKFEEEYAKYIGVKYAVAVSSGTSALHIALLALDIGEGDEVITTPFSFIASTNSIVLSGARPVFSDINPHTFNIDPHEIEKKITKRTKAILPVHLYGLPAEMPEIIKIAKRNKLFVLEDACQSHGAMIFQKKVGSIGDASCFSFYSTKNMYTGEGGMITTNSKSLATKLRLLRSHGSVKQYYHSSIGFNYRMTDIAATLGILQLRKLDSNNNRRISNALLLSKKLEKHKEKISLPFIPDGYKHVFHQYTLRIRDNKISRKKMQTFLAGYGIETRIYYPLPIHKQKVYKDKMKKIKYTHAEAASKKVLSLPVHPQLARKDIERIADEIDNFLRNT